MSRGSIEPSYNNDGASGTVCSMRDRAEPTLEGLRIFGGECSTMTSLRAASLLHRS